MKKKAVSFLVLFFSDMLCIFLCFLLAFLIRKEILPSLIIELQERPVYIMGYFRQFYIYLLWVMVFSYEKLYTKRFTIWEETRLLLKSTTVAFAMVMIIVFITAQYLEFSRLVIVLAWLLSIILLPFFRYLTKILLIKFDLWKKRVIIIGTAESSIPLIEAIQQNKTLGYEIVGCLSGHKQRFVNSINGYAILGHYDDIEIWKIKTKFDDIIVTLPDVPRSSMISLMKSWEQLSENIRYIPRTGDLITTGVEIENIGKVLSLTVRKNLHKPWNILLKKVFEYSITICMFALSVPIFLVIGVLIKLNSRGPVFFVQERLGKRGKIIKVIKFRSMYVDSADKLKQYLVGNPEAQKEWTQFKKLKSFDPRVTGIGKFLRKFSLDELPQLINVLKLDMNLVGPRPYILEELEDEDSLKSILFQVRPGITGLWQISGRSELPFQERLNLDENYIRNWSLWMDIVILIKTFRAALSGKGAF
ncbi:MAG: sugar transferase [Candidatus Aminicenantes bacterium]|nr:sugar transferase [Candidatus Aminicenantes bacterium]